MSIILSIKKHTTEIVTVFLLFLSVTAFIYFFVNGEQHLLYGDALSRLNISRKIIDNLTPGLGQLGNVWLPLPQVFMLPFTSNEFLWHSGIAGYLMNGTFFVIGGVFVYKSIKLVTNSKLGAWFGLLVFSLNINLLYLQTTAMSESIFIGITAMLTFLLLHWAYTKNTISLVAAALCVTAITLVRYEGLALLGTSLLLVGIYTLLSTKNRVKAEGAIIIFSTLAALGFVLWTIYLATIFGDPLYWKNYYVDVKTTQQGVDVTQQLARSNTLFQAILKYVTSVVWMNGLIVVFISILGTIYLVYKTIKLKTLKLFPFILPFSIFVFMILTLLRNTPIEQPELTIGSILSPQTSYLREFNIRYGLLLLGWLAMFSGILFSIRSWILRIFLTLVFLLQIQTYFTNNFSPIYQLTRSISGNNTQGTFRDKELLKGLQTNYDGGLIMISALKHDPQMFQLGVNYSTFIHEGTGKYWKHSITNPQKYATWIVMDYVNEADQVTKHLKDSNVIEKNYKLVFNFENMRIYEIRDRSKLLQIKNE